MRAELVLHYAFGVSDDLVERDLSGPAMTAGSSGLPDGWKVHLAAPWSSMGQMAMSIAGPGRA